MPREYVCRIVLADEFYEDTTCAEDLEALEEHDLPFSELLEIFDPEKGCSVSYEVRDL